MRVSKLNIRYKSALGNLLVAALCAVFEQIAAATILTAVGLGLLVFALVTSEPVLTYMLARWRRPMIIFMLGGVGAAVFMIGGYFAVIQIRDQAQARRLQQDERDADIAKHKILERRLREAQSDLQRAKVREEEHRVRAEKLQQTRIRQLEKIHVALGSFSEALAEAKKLRSQLDEAHTRDAALFAREFESRHAAAIGRWRDRTERMLQDKLPRTGLGTRFKQIDGDRGPGKTPYDVEYSKLVKSMAFVEQQMDVKTLAGYVELEVL